MVISAQLPILDLLYRGTVGVVKARLLSEQSFFFPHCHGGAWRPMTSLQGGFIHQANLHSPAESTLGQVTIGR